MSNVIIIDRPYPVPRKRVWVVTEDVHYESGSVLDVFGCPWEAWMWVIEKYGRRLALPNKWIPVLSTHIAADGTSTMSFEVFCDITVWIEEWTVR